MNVPCPKCKVEFAAPDELLKTGVAKASCPKCSFAFVIRLGDPAQPKQSPAPREPVRLEGVKASADVASAKGTIGTQELRFVPADTYTSIVVDDSLRAEIAAVEKERALDPTTDPEARHLEPSTDVDRPKHIEAVTQVDSVEPEPRVKHIDAVTQVDPLPPPGSPATTRPDPLASAVTESGETQRPAGVARVALPDKKKLAPPPAKAPAPAPATAPAPTAPAPAAATAAAAPAPAAMPAPAATPAPAAAPAPEPAPAAPVATPAPTEPAAAPAAPAPAATPAAPVAAAPAPAPAPAPAQAASALYMPGYGPPTPAAPVAPAPAAQAAPGYPAGFQTGPQLAHHPMAAPPAPQDPSAYGDLDVYGMPRQRSGGKIFGIFLMLILVGGGLFFLFVLARNDWSLDLANFGAMIDRAFGGSRRHRAGALDIAPGQTQILTLHGKKVLVANGVITNNTTKEHRFIYVLGWIKRGATVMASSGEVPAGNVFTDEQLAKMKPKALRSRLNPAGTDGANRSIATGATIGYQIIFNKLPADYSTDRYRVEVKIARSESGPSSP